jgi:hypothetical protein
VILHFAEIFSGTVGRRIMNVSIEGTQRLTNFDIAAAVGFRTATTRQFDVNVKDGMLSITFSATADRPKVSAIEVISSFPPAGVNQLPTANAGADLTITLPANAVTVTGSGTDNDGTIAAFGWAPVTTPVTATVATPNAATTQIGGLTAAGYVHLPPDGNRQPGRQGHRRRDNHGEQGQPGDHLPGHHRPADHRRAV